MVLFSAEKRIVHDFNKKKQFYSFSIFRWKSRQNPHMYEFEILIKKVIFFYHFTNVSKFLILRKKNKKNYRKRYCKLITIDNVIFKFFNKKSHFIKKVNFSIDNDIQYFPPKNLFLYWKNGFQKILEVKKKVFPATWERGQVDPPPIVLLRKRQKVPKFYLWVFWKKLEKYDYQSWNDFYQNFRKNT